jgi:DNA-binding NtrC family response regulator
MNENLIQVLWVEDDPNITRTYPLEAARYGLQLVPFSCWEDAEKALVSEFERWSAIVLDANTSTIVLIMRLYSLLKQSIQ